MPQNSNLPPLPPLAQAGTPQKIPTCGGQPSDSPTGFEKLGSGKKKFDCRQSCQTIMSSSDLHRVNLEVTSHVSRGSNLNRSANCNASASLLPTFFLFPELVTGTQKIKSAKQSSCHQSTLGATRWLETNHICFKDFFNRLQSTSLPSTSRRRLAIDRFTNNGHAYFLLVK